MNIWVEVNGARIEKEFLEANIREAKGYNWSEIVMHELNEHVHCMICGVTIDPRNPTSCGFKSKGGFVCPYCYEHFLGH